MQTYTIRVHGRDEVSAYYYRGKAVSPAAALSDALRSVARAMYDDAGGVYYVVEGDQHGAMLGFESAAVLTERA